MKLYVLLFINGLSLFVFIQQYLLRLDLAESLTNPATKTNSRILAVSPPNDSFPQKKEMILESKQRILELNQAIEFAPEREDSTNSIRFEFRGKLVYMEEVFAFIQQTPYFGGLSFNISNLDPFSKDPDLLFDVHLSL